MITHKKYKVYDEYLYYLIDTFVKHNKYKDIIEYYDKYFEISYGNI